VFTRLTVQRELLCNGAAPPHLQQYQQHPARVNGWRQRRVKIQQSQRPRWRPALQTATIISMIQRSIFPDYDQTHCLVGTGRVQVALTS
jgi:hypothetical protein